MRRPGQQALRRIKTAAAALTNGVRSRPGSSEFLDNDSASEPEDEHAIEVRDFSGYACHHCYSTSESLGDFITSYTRHLQTRVTGTMLALTVRCFALIVDCTLKSTVICAK